VSKAALACTPGVGPSGAGRCRLALLATQALVSRRPAPRVAAAPPTHSRPEGSRGVLRLFRRRHRSAPLRSPAAPRVEPRQVQIERALAGAEDVRALTVRHLANETAAAAPALQRRPPARLAWVQTSCTRSRCAERPPACATPTSSGGRAHHGEHTARELTITNNQAGPPIRGGPVRSGTEVSRQTCRVLDNPRLLPGDWGPDRESS
jgi:hypothetical protein